MYLLYFDLIADCRLDTRDIYILIIIIITIIMIITIQKRSGKVMQYLLQQPASTWLCFAYIIDIDH